jgi:hypothetical protein
MFIKFFHAVVAFGILLLSISCVSFSTGKFVGLKAYSIRDARGYSE